MLDTERVQTFVEPGEMRRALLVEPIDQLGRPFCDGAAFGPFTIEYTERPIELVAMLVAQFVAVLEKVLPERLDIFSAAFAATHRIHSEGNTVQPKSPVKGSCKGDDFNVEIRIIAPDGFHTHLVVLAEAPCL